MISLTLPLPPNANHYRGIAWARKSFYLRPEAKRYRETVKLVSLAAGVREPLDCEVDVSIVVYRARKSGDTDGFLKVLLDAMQESVYVNDRQVRDITIKRRDDKHAPRVEVVVTESPQIIRSTRSASPERAACRSSCSCPDTG